MSIKEEIVYIENHTKIIKNIINELRSVK
jgi:hypothetical protein